MKVMVTGGAGFIGSAVCRLFVGELGAHVLNVDKLTYAADPRSLKEIADDPHYAFEKADICDEGAIAALLDAFAPDAVLHLAAESHVDRSIDGPAAFLKTNVEGTCALLEACRRHWRGLSQERARRFRLLHVSTDEVFGSLGAAGRFDESSPYRPNSPYSASKAAADHLVRAWRETYGLPTITSHSSNNYGPFHFPEKLIPLTILKALNGERIPVYGSGEHVRDWLYVEDHARALDKILTEGRVGESYNLGGTAERTNLEVVQSICRLLDERMPASPHCPHARLISFVADRPGHDRRYAMNTAKITRDLDWRPRESFESGLRKTVLWYLDNRWWWEEIWSRRYRGERLGTGTARASPAP